MEHKHVLGQAFYERAADTMVSGSPNERLETLNQLWDAYLKECASYDEHTFMRTMEALDDDISRLNRTMKTSHPKASSRSAP